VKMFDAGKTRMIGLPCGEKNYDDILIRLDPIPGRYGRTDRIAISISRVSVLTRDKNNIIVECTISSEQNVSKTLISLARLRRVKYGRFWLLSGRREIGAEIRELPENTGDLATIA